MGSVMYNNIKSLAGNFRTLPTFSKMLSSLGGFRKGSVLKKTGNAEHLPFTLNTNGQSFFKELLGLKEIDPKSHLLVASKKEIGSSRSLFKGFSNIPYGLLVEAGCKGSSKPFLLNFAPFLANSNVHPFSQFGNLNAYERITRLTKASAAALFPDQKAEPQQVMASIEETSFPPKLKLIDLPFEGVFSPTNNSALDFQSNILKISDLVRGQTIMEIGCGTGVNLIYAAKLGATSVWATDISLVCVLMSRWNIQYSKDTEQLSQSQAESINIIQENGFGSTPPANLYLFNAPAIIGGDKMQKYLKNDLPLNIRSVKIAEEDFVNLFKELKEKLSVPGTYALWRLLNFVNGVPELFYVNKARTIRFLNSEGIARTNPFEGNDDIFLLKQMDTAKP
ncbi:MAG: 50S ribosomal protein L11 methyltransferase [bacterium]